MSGSEIEFKKSSLMNSVQGSSVIRALTVVVFLCLVSAAQRVAQTQASCTFNVFQLSDLQTTVFGHSYLNLLRNWDYLPQICSGLWRAMSF